MIRFATAADAPMLARLMAESPLLQRYRTTYEGALNSLAGVRTPMSLIKVATLEDAIKSVQTLNRSGDTNALPHC